MPIEFSSGGFERAAREAMNDGLRRLSEQYQRVLDDVLAQHSREPVEQVKTHLARQWVEVNGAELTEPHLTTYADALASGRRVVLQAEEII